MAKPATFPPAAGKKVPPVAAKGAKPARPNPFAKAPAKSAAPVKKAGRCC